MQRQIDIDELIRLAYQKGHAEGMLDIIRSGNTGVPDFLERTAEKTEVMLEVLQEQIAEARLAGYPL